jgi:cytochrome c oxidase subunit 4
MSEPKAHPAAPRYARVFAALVALPGLEVGACYLPPRVRLPLLLLFALAKALLVVLYFMHLRFDNRTYAGLLLIGLLLVSPLILIVALITPAG